MTADIIQKLAMHLRQPIENEAWVVYLLAQTRKLLESGSARRDAPALRMHCHWALHVNLDHSGTVQVLLARFNRWIAHQISSIPTDGTWNFEDESRFFDDLLFMSTFRSQLKHFLLDCGLSDELCSDDEQWRKFLALYCGVIEDGSLQIKSPRGQSIKRVVFSKGKQLPIDRALPFVIQWRVELLDGRTVMASFETTSEDGRLVGRHLQLDPAPLISSERPDAFAIKASSARDFYTP